MGDFEFSIPSLNGLPDQPADTAGGAPASYGTQLLDLFKYGISTAASYNLQKNAQDYAMYGTTNGVVTKAGTTSALGVAPSGTNTTTLLLLGGAVLVGLIVLKKFV